MRDGKELEHGVSPDLLRNSWQASVNVQPTSDATGLQGLNADGQEGERKTPVTLMETKR